MDFISGDGDIVSRIRISDDTFMLRRNRNYTYHQKFPFLLERKRNHIEYYRCVQRYASKCAARLVIRRSSHGNEQIVQLKEHNHSPNTGNLCVGFIQLAIWNFDSRNVHSHSFLWFFFFQTTNRFCTFSIKAICFSSITKPAIKPIGAAHSWLDIANDVRLASSPLPPTPLQICKIKSLKKAAMNTENR